jgi:hypothetical protein
MAMKFKLFLTTIVLAACAAVPLWHVAAQDGQYDLGPMQYRFHLNFTRGQLTPVVKQNDVLPYEFVSDQFVDQPGLYFGKVFSMKNEPLEEFHFNLLEGENDVLGPYFPEAKTVAFYTSNTDTDPLLAISVSKTALCNEDKVCQQDAGETENNCRSDCSVSGSGNVNNANVAPANNANPDIVQKYYSILIIGFIVLGIATMVVFVIIFIRRNRNQ